MSALACAAGTANMMEQKMQLSSLPRVDSARSTTARAASGSGAAAIMRAVDAVQQVLPHARPAGQRQRPLEQAGSRSARSPRARCTSARRCRQCASPAGRSDVAVQVGGRGQLASRPVPGRPSGARPRRVAPWRRRPRAARRPVRRCRAVRRPARALRRTASVRRAGTRRRTGGSRRSRRPGPGRPHPAAQLDPQLLEPLAAVVGEQPLQRDQVEQPASLRAPSGRRGAAPRWPPRPPPSRSREVERQVAAGQQQCGVVGVPSGVQAVERQLRPSPGRRPRSRPGPVGCAGGARPSGRVSTVQRLAVRVQGPGIGAWPLTGPPGARAAGRDPGRRRRRVPSRRVASASR